MVDYNKVLRANNWTLAEPESEPEEEQLVQEPVVVDFVYNTHEDGKGKTIALKLSLRFPQESSRCPRS